MLKKKLGLDHNTIFLVDGSSYLYRAFYAYRNLTRSDGFPTNVIFIVLRLILKILKQEQPTYLGFFVDGKAPTFRHHLFESYKLNRLKMPEPLAMQIAPLLQGLSFLGVSSWILNEVEADDCLASLSSRLSSKYPVVIVGSDKDLFQLLKPNIVLWDPSGKHHKIVTVEDFQKQWGFSPVYWPDFQALVGDSSDNIPGIAGIGPKTAKNLIQKFHSLEELEKNLHLIPKKEQTKIAKDLDKVYLYRQLTTLKKDVCQEITLNDLKVKPINQGALISFCREFEFHSLLSELGFDKTHSKNLPLEDDLKPAARLDNSQVIEIVKVKELEFLKDVFEIGVLLEENNIYLSDGKKDYCLTCDFRKVIPFFQQKNVFCSDFKRLLTLYPALKTINFKWYDLALGAYLLDPEQRDYSFSRLKTGLEHEQGIVFEGKAKAVLAVGKQFLAQLQAANLESLLLDLEQPLSVVLVQMEKRGVLIDKKKFLDFLNFVQQELSKLTSQIYKLAGKEFNIRSSQQLSKVLFEDLKLKGTKKTATGFFSTSESALESLKGEHPIIELILKYRTLEKLRSTYLAPLPEKVDASGRLHTTFNQLATATGRLSSSNPNLQNIPVRGEYGPRVRECFIAPSDCLLISADYSQIELRILAHFSEDPVLLKAFEQDEDVHTATACLIFGKHKEEVNVEDRRIAKTINFGLLYGMGPQKLARELGITLNQAKEFIQLYFEKFSQIKNFYQKIEEIALQNGFVTTVFGRRRLLPQIHSRNAHLVAQAKRMAINTVVQGSAADIIKKAMLLVENSEVLKTCGARQILQIHDEILLEVPEQNSSLAAKEVKNIMENVYKLKIPLKVDLGVGRNWGQAH
ncbi:MAG: DNA polymerase I [Desulfonauticus sp.]|nr:DNA polymerase I [Desulfonauticus sp.]